ncbi:MAG: ParB/RepB/Spo0J family partition protein [Clostridia bacterium]|nr:ParB/RepB/Spo0J family partition protein [Clostridia bacterium]
MAKRGLGKGLGTLFENDSAEIKDDSTNGVSTLKINDVEPNKNQPRKTFDTEKIEALADSIKEHGLIQPIVVTQGKNGIYKIVAGERRWRAAKKAGLKEIPVVINEYTDEQVAEIALIENLQREDLNPIEEALGYHVLLEDFNLTQEMISQKIGKSRSAIANSLRLLSLDDDIKKLLISGEISSGHARAVLSLESSELRLALTKRIIEDNLNVRQAEEIAKQLNKQKKPKKEKQITVTDIETENLANKISSTLGTKVKIMHTAKRGKIEIEYYGNDDLDRILNLLNLS